MKGTELLYKIVLTWNRLEKPTTKSAVNQAALDLCSHLRGQEFDTANEGYGQYSNIFDEFDDADEQLISRLFRKTGKILGLRFLRFIGYFNDGVFYLDNENNPETSLKRYKKAENLWFDKLSEQLYCGNIGLTLSHLDRQDEAIQWFQRALNMAEERGDEESIGIYNQNMGVAYRAKKDLYSARECYKRALAISERRRDEFFQIRVNNLNSIEIDIERFKGGGSLHSIYITGNENLSKPEVLRYSRPLRVFLSHASEDKPRVRELAQRIKDETIDVWIDEERIAAGDQWDNVITYNLGRSDVVIVCLSHKLLEKDTYIKQEIRLAARIASEQNKLLIPVTLEDCPLPQELAGLQSVDYYSVNGHSNLIFSLRRRAEEIGIR